MPITLQTTIAHRRNQQISVNGNSYLIDGRCCIVVDDDDFADAEKLLKTGEWTDKIASVALSTVSRIPMPGDAMRGAVEFVDLLMGDEALAERVRGLRSFRSLQSLAQNLHFRFTEDEYRLATEAVQRAQTTPLKRAAAEPVNVEDEGANESTLPQLPKKPQAKAPAAKKGKDAAPKASSKSQKSKP